MIGVISLLYFLFSAAEIPNQYIDILDLTVGDKIVSDTKMYWGGGGGSSSSRPIVSVTLNLDKDRYVLGEEFIYEVSLKNVSGKEIRIPWDTDGDKINYGKESYSYEDLPEGFMKAGAMIRYPGDILEIDGTTTMSTPPGFVNLYGSNAFASSIKILKPDESILIRAAGRWSNDRINKVIFDKTSDGSNAILEIYASWIFSYGIDFVLYETMYNSPTIQIELEIPPSKGEE